MQVLSGLVLFLSLWPQHLSRLMYLLHLFASHSCRSFPRLRTLLTYIHASSDMCPPLAYYRLVSWVTSALSSNLDSLSSSEYDDTRFSIVHGETG
jgi:hypothetical protein